MTVLRALTRDIRQAWRALLAAPLLAATVVLSLGAGIGVNTVVFSWVQAMLLRPLPGVSDATAFYSIEPRMGDGAYVGVSWPEYRDLSRRLSTFRQLLAFRMAPLYLGEAGQTERAYGLLVSDTYFAALGLRPALGRFLLPEDVARPGGAPVVVISHGYWQTRFGGSADALGQTLRINGARLTVVGVTPRGFEGTVPRLKFDIFLPATLAPVVDAGSRELDDRSNRGYSVMGRLAERGGVAAAREETSAAMAELALRYPATNTGIGADVLAFWDSPRGPQRFMGLALLVLQGILLLMLLSVCSNTANLVLARATARRREVGVRLALGARPGRIVTLLMAENVLLGLGGALAGMLIAFWGTDALRAMPPLRVRGLPITFETHVDGGTLLFAMLAGVASGIVFGLPAALHMARLEPQAAFREGAAASARGGTRAAILAVQVTLATIVLIAGGLVWRSFLETRDQDPGFRRDGILLAAYDLSGRNVPAADRRAFAARVLDAVRAVPGVERAALASSVPLDIHGLPSRVFSVEGHARTDGGVDQALTNTVSPGYFAALDIPLVAGADFVDLSDRTAPAQAIVNETFVREYLGGAVAVGRRIEARGRAFVICGVARNSLYNAFGEPPLPIIYLSYRDNPLASVELHLRTQPHAETAVAAGVRAAIAGLDPELPVYDVRTMRDHVESNLLFRRIPARMFAVLGPLLLALAAIGTYGVVACLVSIRRSEIGVRLALGATAGRVARQFAAESLRVVAASAVVGTALAAVGVLDVLGGARADPVVFGAVPGLLIGTAAAASWIPARQASRLDPASVMKGE